MKWIIWLLSFLPRSYIERPRRFLSPRARRKSLNPQTWHTVTAGFSPPPPQVLFICARPVQGVTRERVWMEGRGVRVHGWCRGSLARPATISFSDKFFLSSLSSPRFKSRLVLSFCPSFEQLSDFFLQHCAFLLQRSYKFRPSPDLICFHCANLGNMPASFVNFCHSLPGEKSNSCLFFPS